MPSRHCRKVTDDDVYKQEGEVVKHVDAILRKRQRLYLANRRLRAAQDKLKVSDTCAAL
jgi:hypothetical protein